MCGRSFEVPSRYAGKDFVHSICGSTLRMAVPREGEPDIELISTPELGEKVTVDLEAIRTAGSHGLFLPRHLRDNSPSRAVESVAQSSAVALSSGEGPGKGLVKTGRGNRQQVEESAIDQGQVKILPFTGKVQQDSG